MSQTHSEERISARHIGTSATSTQDQQTCNDKIKIKTKIDAHTNINKIDTHTNNNTNDNTNNTNDNTNNTNDNTNTNTNTNTNKIKNKNKNTTNNNHASSSSLPSSEDEKDTDGFIGWDHAQRRRSQLILVQNTIANNNHDHNHNHNDKDKDKHNAKHTAKHNANDNNTHTHTHTHNNNHDDDGNATHNDTINDVTINPLQLRPGSASNTNVSASASMLGSLSLSSSQYPGRARLDSYTSRGSNNFDNSQEFDDQYDYYDDDNDNDNDNEHDKWAVRVRLISAVDLPSNLNALPHIPLCPLFKFGLLTLADTNIDTPDTPDTPHTPETSTSQTHTQTHTQTQTQTQTGHNHASQSYNSNSNSNMLSHLDLRTLELSKASLSTDNPNYSYATVKQSSAKIISTADNGMMEWQEDLRWDNVSPPLQTVLMVELSARAALPPDFHIHSAHLNVNAIDMTTNHDTNLTYDTLYQQAVHHQTEDYVHGNLRHNPHLANDTHHANNNGVAKTHATATGIGFLGFWRKGRETLEHRRQRSKVNLTSTAAASASLVSNAANTTTTTNDNNNNHLSTHSSNTIHSSASNGHLSGDKNAEIEAARAAAEVARFLMEKDQDTNTHTDVNVNTKNVNNNNNNNVTTTTTSTSMPFQHSAITNTEYTGKSANSTANTASGSELNSILDEIYSDDKPTTYNQANDNNNRAMPDPSSTTSTTIIPAASLCSNAKGDLRLGNLLIPLSDLPLEDECPTVQKWFQLDTQTPLKPTDNAIITSTASSDNDATDAANTTTNEGGNGNSNSNSSITSTMEEHQHQHQHQHQQQHQQQKEEQHKNLNASRRSPSVLLEISFCRAHDLDEKEREAHALADTSTARTKSSITSTATATAATTATNSSTTATDQDNLGVMREQEVLENPPLFSQKNQHSMLDSVQLPQEKQTQQQPTVILQRRETPVQQQQRIMLEEKELIRKNGPFLKPGIVDFLCVVGAKDIGDQKNDDGSKGWVESNTTSCVLEQFPPNDDFHAKHGR